MSTQNEPRCATDAFGNPLCQCGHSNASHGGIIPTCMVDGCNCLAFAAVLAPASEATPTQQPYKPLVSNEMMQWAAQLTSLREALWFIKENDIVFSEWTLTQLKNLEKWLAQNSPESAAPVPTGVEHAPSVTRNLIAAARHLIHCTNTIGLSPNLKECGRFGRETPWTEFEQAMRQYDAAPAPAGVGQDTPTITLTANGGPVRLIDCPPGVFMFNGSIHLKTEYGDSSGDEVYCGDSGEYFWGGAESFDARKELMVIPMNTVVPDDETIIQWADRVGVKHCPASAPPPAPVSAAPAKPDDPSISQARKGRAITIGDRRRWTWRALTNGEQESEIEHRAYQELTDGERAEVILAWGDMYKAHELSRSLFRRYSDGFWSIMIVCNACSKAGGADREIHHAPPECDEPAAAPAPTGEPAKLAKLREAYERTKDQPEILYALPFDKPIIALSWKAFIAAAVELLAASPAPTGGVAEAGAGRCRFCGEASCYCCPECGQNVAESHGTSCSLDPAKGSDLESFAGELIDFTHGAIDKSHAKRLIVAALHGRLAAAALAGTSQPAPEIAEPLEAWHEDYGQVMWWKFPVEEAPYIGSPLDDDWPGYHTHWTPLPKVMPVPREPLPAPAAVAQANGGASSPPAAREVQSK